MEICSVGSRFKVQRFFWCYPKVMKRKEKKRKEKEGREGMARDASDEVGEKRRRRLWQTSVVWEVWEQNRCVLDLNAWQSCLVCR